MIAKDCGGREDGDCLTAAVSAFKMSSGGGCTTWEDVGVETVNFPLRCILSPLNFFKYYVLIFKTSQNMKEVLRTSSSTAPVEFTAVESLFYVGKMELFYKT